MNAASKESSRLTGLSNAYMISTSVISHRDSIKKPAKPRRYRNWKFVMFAAVAAASPDTIILDGTYASPNPPATIEIRNRTPAVLAYLCTFISDSSKEISIKDDGAEEMFNGFGGSKDKIYKMNTI